MARVEIPIVTFDFATQKVVSGATVTITDRATEASVTIFADESSGLTLAQPLVSDAGGRVDGWLPRGAYLATIDPPGGAQYTEPFDLAPASDGSIDGDWAGPDIALQADLDAAIASIPPGYGDADMVSKLARLASGDKIAWETAGGDFVELWASRVPAGSYASDFEDAYETDPTAVPTRITGEATDRTGAGIAYVPADTSVRASGSGAATYIHNNPPAATSDFRATAQIKYDFNQQGGLYIRKSAGVGLLAYVDFGSGVAGFYVDTSTDGHRFISSPALYSVPADPWLQFTKSGNTITLRLFNGDPDAGGVQVGADGSYTFTAGDVATWGTPTYTVGGYIVAAGTPFAAIRTLRHAVVLAAETRDLFVAITPASGVRTVRRLFGSSGSSFRSDFLQPGDIGGTVAPLASPTFTGDPKAPTPAAGDNDTSIATTAFIQGEIAAKAPLASPAFSGTVGLPTYTEATKPTPASVGNGRLIYVSDGAAGANVQVTIAGAWVGIG